MTTSTLSPNTDVPTHDELVARARELKAVLRERADRVEDTRNIPQDTIDDLAAAGLFRLTVPRVSGGYEVSGRTLSEVLSILAEGDASTAWVVGVYAGGAANVSQKNDQMQAELFRDGPDLRICGSGTPSKDVSVVDGGYQVSGRWFSVSGSAHADWAALFLAPPADGGAPKMLQALIPLNDLSIDRTWDAAGMRGTESDTVVASGVFVPSYRTEELAGPPPADPIMSVGPCAIPVGIAQGALERAIEYAQTKPWAGTSYVPARESTSFQVEIADAAMHIESARLHLFRAIDTIDAARTAGEQLDVAVRARCRGDAGWVMKNITDAIDAIMTAIGAGAFSEASPFERAWRDISTTARHGAVNYLINREIYGKVLLGLDGNISRLPV